jgi:hypothetical protein
MRAASSPPTRLSLNYTAKLVPEFSSTRLSRKEAAGWDADCVCSQQVEARRAELHASLARVLVIDTRFNWNGIGNSLPRWMAMLRFGLASGRATYMWMSDAGLARERPNASAPLDRSQARRAAKASLRRREAYASPKPIGFDLGSYYRAMGGDWRWAQSTRRRVRAAMGARNVSGPALLRYWCKRHTWACMEPCLEVGPISKPPLAALGHTRLEEGCIAQHSMAHSGPYAMLYALLQEGFAGPTESMCTTHEGEKDGHLLAWLAARPEPWLLFRVMEQTAIEQSTADSRTRSPRSRTTASLRMRRRGG